MKDAMKIIFLPIFIKINKCNTDKPKIAMALATIKV